MINAPALPLGDDELALFDDFFTTELGLSFPEHKREILAGRLRPRLAQLRLSSFLQYYALLLHDSGNGRAEVGRAADLVTNNESYFFRETYQFEMLFSELIEELKAASGAARRMRFLSAGCSSGEEPYTLNIFARENQYRMFGYHVAIDAFDLSGSRIAMSESAEYTTQSLRGLTGEQVERYFQPAGNAFRLKSLYRSGVSFRVGNLLRPDAYGAPGSYDVIFCRNVLIYFTEAMMRAAIDRFHTALRPGGVLFLGHSESAIGLSRAFEPERVGDCIAYRRNSSYRPAP